MTEEVFSKNMKNESPLQIRTKKQLLTHHLNYENREYAIELIPIKSYKKGLMFLLAKTIKDIINHLIAQASKGVFTKINVSIYSDASQYSGDIKACKKLVSPINR